MKTFILQKPTIISPPATPTTSPNNGKETKQNKNKILWYKI